MKKISSVPFSFCKKTWEDLSSVGKNSKFPPCEETCEFFVSGEYRKKDVNVKKE